MAIPIEISDANCEGPARIAAIVLHFVILIWYFPLCTSVFHETCETSIAIVDDIRGPTVPHCKPFASAINCKGTALQGSLFTENVQVSIFVEVKELDGTRVRGVRIAIVSSVVRYR